MALKTWVIVANSTLARIFNLKGLILDEQNALVHPESRMRAQDLVSDKPGVAFAEGPSMGRFATTSKTPPKKVEEALFAKKLAALLEKGRTSGQFERLFLAASPEFLGLVRQELSRPCEELIEKAVSKDITTLKPEEIRGYFPIGL